MASLTPNPHISAARRFRADLSFKILPFLFAASLEPKPTISLAVLMCYLCLSNQFLQFFCPGLSTVAEAVVVIVRFARQVV